MFLCSSFTIGYSGLTHPIAVGLGRTRDRRHLYIRLDLTTVTFGTFDVPKAMAAHTNAGNMVRIGIVGAGMAGLSCAQELRRKGHDTVSFDKGRGPGGRMSTRRIDTPPAQTAFDYGVQYFTVRDPAFVTQVATWVMDGHVARWATAGTDA